MDLVILLLNLLLQTVFFVGEKQEMLLLSLSSFTGSAQVVIFSLTAIILFLYRSFRNLKHKNRKLQEEVKRYSSAFSEATEKLMEKESELLFKDKVLQEKNQELFKKTEKLLELHERLLQMSIPAHNATPREEAISTPEQPDQIILSSQEKTIEKNIVLTGEGNISYKGNIALPQDDQFLKKIIHLIERNISDPELNGDRICREIGMSKSVLYVKLKNITGQTVNEFIRVIRLKKSTTLLYEEKLTVAQIAHEMGFNSPSYYSRSFTQLFGVSPTEYIQKCK